MFATILALGFSTLPITAGEPPSRSDADQTLIDLVNPVTYEIAQRITVTNQDVSALDMLELNLPIPLDWPAQRVQSINVVGDRTFQLRDVDGLGLMVRSRYSNPTDLPGPNQSRSLEVQYRLTRKETRTSAEKLSRRSYPPYDNRSTEYRLYTRSEKRIEVEAPDIVKVATALKTRVTTPYQFAEAAYHFVIDSTEYVTPSPSHHALECLHNKKGDCGSYTLLFVALCRAGGVPARPVAGCWASGENQWHCWAEFLLPGVGWVPADPTVGERGPREREYYFGNLDNNRVALAKSFNLKVDTDRGSTELGFVQVGTWWWYPAPGSTGSHMNVEHLFRGHEARAPNHP